MINNTVLVGRLTRDPELKYTGSGLAVASFNIAVERPFSNANGEKETDFINCVVWKKTAEALSNFTSKGSLIGLTGRIQTRNYEGNDGKRVYVTEVVAENVKFLEPKKTSKKESSSSESDYVQNSKNDVEDAFDKNEDIDISDDDLPF
ncbi:single-stranded DNA-binding protein [Alkalibacterium sp. f15]|uniref:single-stranded DNA-binding protein n=1 Tax=Alkalibacterium sp. f15 TaxID=3414029 RepID=UPI003BF85076